MVMKSPGQTLRMWQNLLIWISQDNKEAQGLQINFQIGPLDSIEKKLEARISSLKFYLNKLVGTEHYFMCFYEFLA
jgi:hypothetical protein